jgi:hypothetical protein
MILPWDGTRRRGFTAKMARAGRHGQNGLVSTLAPHLKPTSRYAGPPRVLPPLPPRWSPPATWERHPPRVPLWEFVILSMLLHLMGILLFGAPSGGSREGRALWGSLDVVIRESLREPAPALKMDRQVAVPSAPPTPTAVPRPPAPVPEAPPKPAEETSPVPVPEMLQRLERTPQAPPFEVPKPAEPAPLEAVPLAPLAAPTIQRRLVDPPKVEAPLPLPKPIEPPRIERIAPPVERQIVEPPKVEAPLPPPKPIELPKIERIAPPVQRQIAEPPKLEAPLLQPLRPIEALPIERVETPVERPLAEPPRIEAPIAQPVETTAVPAARVDKPPVPGTAPAIPREEATPAAPVAPAPATSTPASPAAREATPRSEREVAPIEQGPSASPFRTAPPKPGDAAPSTYDPTAPALDADALRKRAGELMRQGTGNRAALAFPMPPVEKPKTTMESAIEKARKPDCRTAYKDLGLAAIVPLIANEFGEGSCRW